MFLIDIWYYILVLCDFDIAYGNVAAVGVDAPAVLLDTVDTLCRTVITVDVGYDNRIVCKNINFIGILRRNREDVSVSTRNEPFGIRSVALLLGIMYSLRQERLLRMDTARVRSSSPWVGYMAEAVRMESLTILVM